MVCFPGKVVTIDAITGFGNLWLGKALLWIYAPLLFLAFKALKCLVVHFALKISYIQITKGHEDGVRWMVVRGVKLFQLGVAKINNVLRLATTVVVISCCREKYAADALPQLRYRRRHRAFHLIKHNTFVYQLRIWIRGVFEFNSVAFLGKI